MKTALFRNQNGAAPLLAIATLVLLLVGVGSAMYVSQHRQDNRSRAADTNPCPVISQDQIIKTPPSSNEIQTLDIITNKLKAQTQTPAPFGFGAPSPEVSKEDIITRKKIILSLAAEDPVLAQKYVLPKQESQKLNYGPNCIEQPASVSGTVGVIHGDDFLARKDTISYYATKNSGEKISLAVGIPNNPVVPGQTISATGAQLDNTLFVGAPNNGTIQVVGAVSPTTVTGPQKVFVGMAYSGTLPSLTKAKVDDVVFTQLNNYYKEVSYNNISVTGQSSGWIPSNRGVPSGCGSAGPVTAIAQDIVTNQATRVDFSTYKYILITTPGCDGSTGWAYGPTNYLLPNGQSVTLNTMWVSSEYFQVFFTGHELGHNLGLWPHSRSMNYWCNTDPTLSTSTVCPLDEYGDTYDIMGITPGHINAARKQYLGWLGASQITTVTQSGTYTIEPLETASTGLKGVRIIRPGKNQSIFVEYRTRTGIDGSFYKTVWDTVSTTTNVYDGASLHISDDRFPPSNTYLITAVKANVEQSNRNVALPVGSTFNDPDTGIKITVVSKNANNTLTVQLQVPIPTPMPCTNPKGCPATPQPTPVVTQLPTPVPSVIATPTPIPTAPPCTNLKGCPATPQPTVTVTPRPATPTPTPQPTQQPTATPKPQFCIKGICF